ncbi:hypothetical protein LSM04_004576 [Trypanosoma melophagium]|uniref:uncharacterized protein n=1 Tax=Trypanosoma melophagium TaxID=715481 RepID=UPI00351A594B|nr:hypothetical protein LSM04_004576 [Trypanosoma melophagium]
MLRELFEVGRVDRATNSLEAIFLDGTRQKLKVFTVRPAGFLEKELFRKWKSDASTRPVRTVYAGLEGGASTPTPPVASLSVNDGRSSNHNSIDGGNNNNNNNNNNNKGSVMVDDGSGADLPTPWWVIPQLLVRLVEVSAGDLFGKKFIVKSVLRKEGKIRLVPWPQRQQEEDRDSVQVVMDAVIDVIGCAALETVVPKVNEEGIVVLGAMRGELVTVISRQRSSSNEIIALKVRSTLTGNEFTLGPQEICQMATRRAR